MSEQCPFSKKLAHVAFEIPPSSFSTCLWLNNPDSGATMYLYSNVYFLRFTLCILHLIPTDLQWADKADGLISI